MIHFACPNCSTTYEVPARRAGKKTTCPACRWHFRVPDPAEEVKREEELPDAYEAGYREGFKEGYREGKRFMWLFDPFNFLEWFFGRPRPRTSSGSVEGIIGTLALVAACVICPPVGLLYIFSEWWYYRRD